jgi:hypothetical protein
MSDFEVSLDAGAAPEPAEDQVLAPAAGDEDTGADAPAEGGGEEPEGEEPAEPQPHRGGVQKRIDKLTAEKYELQGRLRQLEESLHRQAQPQPPQPAQQAQNAEPQMDEFETVDEYLRARDTWLRNDLLTTVQKQQQEAQERARHQQQQQVFSQKLQGVKAKYADFDAAVVYNPAMQSPVLGHALMACENGAELAYIIGKNPALSAQFANNYDPVSVGIALGRIEAQMATLAPKRQSSAPAPISPTRPNHSPNKDPGSMTPEEYRAYKRKMQGA